MEFLRDAARLMGWSGAVLVPIVGLRVGWTHAVGLAGGIAWVLLNAWVMSRLIQEAFVSGRPRSRRALGFWLLKLPTLYAVAAVLLLSPWSSPVGFLAGFSWWFVTLLISALRRAVAPSHELVS